MLARLIEAGFPAPVFLSGPTQTGSSRTSASITKGMALGLRDARRHAECRFGINTFAARSSS